jgi:hypothetical protein
MPSGVGPAMPMQEKQDIACGDGCLGGVTSVLMRTGVTGTIVIETIHYRRKLPLLFAISEWLRRQMERWLKIGSFPSLITDLRRITHDKAMFAEGPANNGHPSKIYFSR